MGRPPATTDRVIAQLAADIVSGTTKSGEPMYPAGSWLPSTRKLAATYNASRNTVMGALRILAGRDLVDLHEDQGATVTVRKFLIVTRKDYGAAEDEEEWRGFPPAVVEAGKEHFLEIVSSREVPASREVAKRLGIPADTTVFERDRRQGYIESGKQVPVQRATSWYTMATVQAVPEIRTVPEFDPPPVRQRMLELERAIHYEHVIEWQPGDPDMWSFLELPEGTPLAEVWRECIDNETGERLEVTRIIDDARRVKIKY